ncbi:hypothetical protein NPA07_03325 [Mycoplasmopsis caviae]|uniref:Uncharacterized protein n=1 Tax=Mycoplasmopsis caviae TaxID=55603 RepID=A0A3P8KN75_9BACT|nr:hypothetical protein [Mycoplasmopsis caviae]UUD34828.1 hypothetical protein NPA07_03325 [Mycoplasmopsis caviae]VDR42318.1 Uncharacterised protein [Mycoplasmopsis caviae]
MSLINWRETRYRYSLHAEEGVVYENDLQGELVHCPQCASDEIGSSFVYTKETIYNDYSFGWNYKNEFYIEYFIFSNERLSKDEIYDRLIGINKRVIKQCPLNVCFDYSSKKKSRNICVYGLFIPSKNKLQIKVVDKPFNGYEKWKKKLINYGQFI